MPPIPFALLLLMLPLLSACGYHLVGTTEEHAIPGATTTIVVSADTPLGQQAKSMLIEQMAENPHHRFVIHSEQPHTTLHIQQLTASWSTQGFDSNGVANRYQIALQGSLWLQPPSEQPKQGWRSGTITRQEELFASGGPVAIEANRSQLRHQLLTRWVEGAINRLRSGF